MSQGVNVKFAKCFIIFMALVILIQGVIYLGLAIWGIMMHNCAGDNSDPVNRPFEFVLDLIYFSREKCGAPSLFIADVGTNLVLDVNFQVAEVLSNREYIFLIVYIVISALWVVISFFVLVTICGTITKVVAAVCFWPWLIVVLAGSVFDAVATGYHIHDITQTTSAESAFNYAGIENVGLALDYLKGYDVYFITPAVAFTCISSRVVLIWLLNIFGSIFCLSLAKVISSNDSQKKKDKQHRLPVDTTAPAQRRQMQEIQEQDTVALRYHPSAPPSDSVRRTLEPLKSPVDNSPPIDYNGVYPPPVSRQQSQNKRINELKTQASINNNVPTYQVSEAHPENLDYPNTRHSTLSTIHPLTPELSPASPLNQRYSSNEGFPFHNQPHVSQELRGQLPWSYTNIMNDPIAQKMIQSHLQPDDEDFPPIPVPDYTLHPPKKDRGPVNPDRTSQSNYSRW